MKAASPLDGLTVESVALCIGLCAIAIALLEVARAIDAMSDRPAVVFLKGEPPK